MLIYNLCKLNYINFTLRGIIINRDIKTKMLYYNSKTNTYSAVFKIFLLKCYHVLRLHSNCPKSIIVIFDSMRPFSCYSILKTKIKPRAPLVFHIFTPFF